MFLFVCFAYRGDGHAACLPCAGHEYFHTALAQIHIAQSSRMWCTLPSNAWQWPCFVLHVSYIFHNVATAAPYDINFWKFKACLRRMASKPGTSACECDAWPRPRVMYKHLRYQIATTDTTLFCFRTILSLSCEALALFFFLWPGHDDIICKRKTQNKTRSHYKHVCFCCIGVRCV